MIRLIDTHRIGLFLNFKSWGLGFVYSRGCVDASFGPLHLTTYGGEKMW